MGPRKIKDIEEAMSSSLLSSHIKIICNYFNLSPNSYKISNDKELITDCPNCHKPGHFYINIKSKKYICFKCNFRGGIEDDRPENVVDVKSKLLDVVNYISDAFNPNIIIEPKWYDLFETIDALYAPEALDYLKGRKLSEELISYYNIRYSFKLGRIIIPNIFTDDYKTDMFVARDITGKSKMKYLNPTNSHSKSSIFNLHRVKGSFEDVIISEGVLSAISSGLNGVATYGKSVSKEQIDTLCSCNFRRYYISAESDAIDFAVHLADRIRNKGKDVYLIELPEGKDANDMEQEEFLSLVGRTKKYTGRFFVSSVLDIQKKIERKDYKILNSTSDSFKKAMLFL